MGDVFMLSNKYNSSWFYRLQDISNLRDHVSDLTLHLVPISYPEIIIANPYLLQHEGPGGSQ